MSLTSYRAAPPRANHWTVMGLVGRVVLKAGRPPRDFRGKSNRRTVGAGAWCRQASEWVRCCMGIAPATKPGGVLLFHRLSDSTIGAVWFHGRVRDGIGWVTDAMATKLCGRRDGHLNRNDISTGALAACGL